MWIKLEHLLRARWTWGALAAAALALSGTAIRPRPLLVWNVSASAPVGLYGVRGMGDLARGDMVIARLPEGLRLFAARRGYLPLNVPLVKSVAAVPGDRVCAFGPAVSVNGRFVAGRFSSDMRGRDMPWWLGCVDLLDEDYLLLMPDSAASFDGRYFGISSGKDVIGEATLLWRR